jgi:hypothetical protein
MHIFTQNALKGHFIDDSEREKLPLQGRPTDNNSAISLCFPANRHA